MPTNVSCREYGAASAMSRLRSAPGDSSIPKEDARTAECVKKRGGDQARFFVRIQAAGADSASTATQG